MRDRSRGKAGTRRRKDPRGRCSRRDPSRPGTVRRDRRRRRGARRLGRCPCSCWPRPTPVAAVVPFTVRGSVNQVSVTGLTPGRGGRAARQRRPRRSRSCTTTGTRRPTWPTPRAPTCSARCRPAPGTPSCPRRRTSDPVTVTDHGRQPAAVVLRPAQRCRCSASGFSYIPTRDGTTLSANITFPDETEATRSRGRCSSTTPATTRRSPAARRPRRPCSRSRATSSSA